LIVTPGQGGDAPQAEALLKGLRTRHVLADAAYDSERYKHRNVIERFFRRIKQCRRVATRYEKKAESFAAFVWLAAGVTTPCECP
jgi:putative transposase